MDYYLFLNLCFLSMNYIAPRNLYCAAYVSQLERENEKVV